MKQLLVALLVLFALNVADITVTSIGLSLGATELNPIYHMQGFQTAFLTKLAVMLIAMPIYMITYAYLRRNFPNYVQVLWILLYLLIGFYGFILGNNVIQLVWKLLGV